MAEWKEAKSGGWQTLFNYTVSFDLTNDQVDAFRYMWNNASQQTRLTEENMKKALEGCNRGVPEWADSAAPKEREWSRLYLGAPVPADEQKGSEVKTCITEGCLDELTHAQAIYCKGCWEQRKAEMDIGKVEKPRCKSCNMNSPIRNQTDQLCKRCDVKMADGMFIAEKIGKLESIPKDEFYNGRSAQEWHDDSKKMYEMFLDVVAEKKELQQAMKRVERRADSQVDSLVAKVSELRTIVSIRERVIDGLHAMLEENRPKTGLADIPEYKPGLTISCDGDYID